MPFDTSLVGTTLGPFEYEVDAGWTIAYAARVTVPENKGGD